jgi:hypothetical protein
LPPAFQALAAVQPSFRASVAVSCDIIRIR